jgi:RNA-directed DNA polymerase
VVTYADDFVILSRGHAAEALDWAGSVMTRLGLTLNEARTSIKAARKESFQFLGYTFGILRGWSAYFSYSSRATAYREVNNYVSDRVRHFLKRRHKVQSRGAEYYGKRVFGELKVVRLGPPPQTA